LAAGLAGSAVAPALADSNKSSTENCFASRDWAGWKSPSPSVIYIRVRGRDIYRLDLAGKVSDLDWPDEHLVSKMVGSDYICSPLDLQLELSDGHGMREPLIVKTITKLTPEEAAAIPPKFRP
jgi:hypothetical protein